MAQHDTPDPATDTDEESRTAAGFHLLARVTRARRKRLGLSQHDVREHDGPSFRALQHIEGANTTSLTPLTFSKLDRGLSWPSGTAYCLVHADNSEAIDNWDDFVSISINDTCPPNGETVQNRLHRNRITSLSGEIETLNHYLLFADYGVAALQDPHTTDDEHAQHLGTVRDCIHRARYIVLGWINEQNKDN